VWNEKHPSDQGKASRYYIFLRRNVIKRNIYLHTTILTVFAFFALAACQAWATIPLSQPSGVAVDPQGNIYVANSATNQILVYDVNRVQRSSKTISAGLAHPSGLAFDSNGNLWVANYGQTGYDSSVTEYNSKGQQNTGATITANLQFTLGIAVDSGLSGEPRHDRGDQVVSPRRPAAPSNRMGGGGLRGGRSRVDR